MPAAHTQAQLNVAELAERNALDRGVDHETISPREIHCVGVIGAGTMGCRIAAANLKCGLNVVVTDADAEAVARSRQTILEEAFDGDWEGRLPEAAAEPTRSVLRQTSRAQDLAPCDLILESIVETLEVKRTVLRRIEPDLDGQAILASNTSTIPITQLATSLKQPERFCGIHFCNPVRHRKLVEIVRGEATDDATITTAVAYAKRLEKMPIVVQDSPGFLVNRLLFPYLIEAVELITAGAAIEDVEQAARSFGMALGPFELYDMIGIDTAFYAGRSMWDAFRDRVIPSPMIPAMIKNGRLGQKNGLGFYDYRDPQAPQLDPAAKDLLAVYVKGRETFSADELTTRLFLPMVLEATRALEERIVRDARDVDLALLFGLGFPRSKGGLLFWADTFGARKIVEMLKPLAELGARTVPTDLLRDMASRGAKFY